MKEIFQRYSDKVLEHLNTLFTDEVTTETAVQKYEERTKKKKRISLFPSGTLSYLTYLHSICSCDFVVDSEFLYHLISCYLSSNLGSLSNRHYLHFLMQVQN